MKKILIGLLIVILLNSCTKKTDSEVVIDGIVISSQNNSLLVAAADDSRFQSFEPISVTYENSNLDFNQGDMVEIGFNGVVAKSYPSQIQADYVQIKEKVTSEYWPATQTLPNDYISEKAIKDGCFVVSIDEVYSLEKLDAFVQNTKIGIAGYLRKVIYTDEGDAIITDIIFDGKNYTLVNDSTRDKFGSGNINLKKFPYLQTYNKNNIYDIYLADKDNISEEEYETNLNSNTNSIFDYYSIYFRRESE